MKKSDVLAADIILYALRQIQMAKYDRQLSGELEYWNGEIMSMKYLLLYIDKRLGKKKKNDLKLQDIYKVFDRVDEKRKEQFEILWSAFWEEE